MPRGVSSCRPNRYYRAPGLGLAGGLSLLNMIGADWLRETTSAVHPVNITTQEDCYELQSDCPGMSQEDIHVEVSPDRVLTISGARKTAAKSAHTRVHNNDKPIAASDAAAAAHQPSPDLTPTATAKADPPERLPSAETPKVEVSGVKDAPQPAAAPQEDADEANSTACVTYRFRRSFVLPDDADVDSISAAMDKGVLTLTIPRCVQPKPQPRRITIN